jgi:WD40 repeat protein
MKFQGFGYVLGISVAAALLAACGGSQSPIATAGASAQPVNATQSRAKGLSSSSGDLLYVADGKSDVRVFAYPSGSFIERVTSVLQPGGMCSDSQGNIFVLNRKPYQILEFAHGGTEPITTIGLRDLAQTCSVDPKTNDLAVPQGNSIAIYPNEQGPAQTYSDPNVQTFDVCTYDGQGNLFLSAFSGDEQVLIELVPATGAFSQISLNQDINELYGLQWDGKYLAVNSFTGNDAAIYHVEVRGFNGKVVGTTPLKGAIVYGWLSLIQDHTVMAPVGGEYRNLYFWNYPSGGRPIRALRRKNLEETIPIVGFTVSVAPGDKH